MANEPTLTIDLHDVAKTYKGKVHALRGVAMQVHPQQIFGLLGPNGAGKSTLVKIMMTVVRPTRAAGRILGAPVGHKPTLRRIGYLPENHSFPPYLTGRQALEFYAAMSKVDRPTRRRRAAELLERVGMKDYADRKVATYSKGMMQRVGLAQAMVHDPDLIVLDEPTDGVDPAGRRGIREVLRELRAEGKTIFINSHLLSELEVVCDRVAILVSGQVVRQGTIDDLTRDSRHYELELELAGPDAADRIAAALPCAVAPGPRRLGQGADGAVRRGRWPDGPEIEIDGACLRVATGEAAGVQPVIDALRGAGLALRSLRPVRQSLEDLFMEAVGNEGDRTRPPGRWNAAGAAPVRAKEAAQ